MRLKINTQWVCDRCGRLIDGGGSGTLEWDVREDLKRSNYRIVHHRSDADGYRHLWHFTGDDGRRLLMSHQGPKLVQDPRCGRDPGIGVADLESFMEVMRRIHSPYYEEARIYAKQDGGQCSLETKTARRELVKRGRKSLKPVKRDSRERRFIGAYCIGS